MLENSVLDVLCKVVRSLFIENKYNGLFQLLVLIINVPVYIYIGGDFPANTRCLLVLF